jgi:hypothetical protein
LGRLSGIRFDKKYLTRVLSSSVSSIAYLKTSKCRNAEIELNGYEK